MHSAVGQKYVVNVFGRGIAQDLLHDLPAGQVRDTYIRSDRMAINQDLINALKTITGDVIVSTVFSGSGNMLLLASVEMDGYMYTFWANGLNAFIRIYRDNELIGLSESFPGSYSNGYLYVDANPDTTEIAVTDNDQVPIIFDMDDLYANKSTTVYTTDYDSSLYEINQRMQLSPPVFRGLSFAGLGGGLRPGSYAYATRLVAQNGDYTPWGPVTPFIPVPVGYGSGGEPTIVPGAKTYGGPASLTNTRYGVDLTFRIVNYAGFDYVEVKRIANNSGGPVEYTSPAESLRLSTVITDSIMSVIEFSDGVGLNWAPLDESNTVHTNAIAAARTVRFYSGRLVLGGITYESRLFSDTTVFNDFSSVASQGIAFKEGLGYEGYTDIFNQVYKKSQRLGERYSYAMQLVDDAGNRSFAVPIPDLQNFKFPERRDKFGTGELTHSPYVAGFHHATVDSDSGQDTEETYEVYRQGDDTKDSARLNNIVTEDNYQPVSPVNREDNDDTDLAVRTCQLITGGGDTYVPEAFGHRIIGTGMKIAGLDTSKLPSWVSGFSILRSEPAGRVVAQGIATYALIEQDVADTSPSLQKALDKLWVYSPEFDNVIGDKAGLFADMISNPGDYQLQLVSPVAWFPEYYAGYQESGAGGKIDFATYAMAYYSADDINPYDVVGTTGRGDGYVTFGRWRNQSNQGAGITDDFIFDIDAAVKNSLGGKEGRSSYLELTLGAEVYANQNIAAADTAISTNARNFHEPFYIVNIIRNGAVIADTSGDVYREIGHHINLDALVGIGSGILDQRIKVVSERPEDFYDDSAAASTDFRYIYVDGKSWLDVTSWSDGDINTIRAALASSDSFTLNSCNESYGIYKVTNRSHRYYIHFPYQTTEPADIVPVAGEEINIRYDNRSPIEIMLGDVVIGPASFVPIDCKPNNIWTGSAGDKEKYFKFSCAFPFIDYTGLSTYKIPDLVVSGTPADRWKSGVEVGFEYVRQWLVMFMCESTVNLPFVYKDFFPYMNYVMRPNAYQVRGAETMEEYLETNNVHIAYNVDYPNEWDDWQYGGFHFPQGSNFDYQKLHHNIYTEAPVGISEVLDYPKRLQWGIDRALTSIIHGTSKLFLATNVYDVQLKAAKEINILYDQYTGKGANLYAVLDRGVIGLITDKSLLRDGVSDELGVVLSDAGFIQGEIWIDPFVGAPDLRWRGRAEGTIKTQNNNHIPALIFVGDDDIYLLSGNSVVALGTNYRSTLNSLIRAITDSTVLNATIDHNRNELWVIIGGDIYIYGFSVNNWVGKVSSTNLVALDNSKIYDGTRLARVGVIKYFLTGITYVSKIVKGDDGFDWDSEKSNPVLSFDIAVTPEVGAQFEFTDIFINSSIRPSNVYASITDDFSTDPFSAVATDIKDVDGLYRFTLGRTDDNDKVLIGNTLYIRIAFTNSAEVTVGYVKTGYKNVTGH